MQVERSHIAWTCFTTCILVNPCKTEETHLHIATQLSKTAEVNSIIGKTTLQHKNANERAQQIWPWQVKWNVNAVFRQMHWRNPSESGLSHYIPSCPWVALTISTTVHFNVQHMPLKLLQFFMIHISYTLLIFSPFISQQTCNCVKGEKLLIMCVHADFEA